MSLSCSVDYGDGDFSWFWERPKDEEPLKTKRSRKCCSCRKSIKVGDVSRKIIRYRHATEWEYDKGFPEEAYLADWYLCETCGDLADSLDELKFCYSIGDESLKKQIDDYRKYGEE